MKKLGVFFLLIITQVALAGTVVVLKINGSINPATSDYIHEGIKRAEEKIH